MEPWVDAARPTADRDQRPGFARIVPGGGFGARCQVGDLVGLVWFGGGFCGWKIIWAD